MLFGRKKPGFFEEEPVEAAPARAEDAETAGQQNLLEYMESLPEAEDDEFGDVKMPEIPVKEVELTEAQQLAEYIRLRTKGVQLTGSKRLLEEVDNFMELKKQWEDDEICQDIVFVKGAKDEYYYSNQYMSDNYAMIASLVEEKDLPRTIAKMVRFNCKTYPAPTPYSYFERSPYFASAAQIERARTVLGSSAETQDIKSLENNEGDKFFYSIRHMSARYAQALADVDIYTD